MLGDVIGRIACASTNPLLAKLEVRTAAAAKRFSPTALKP